MKGIFIRAVVFVAALCAGPAFAAGPVCPPYMVKLGFGCAMCPSGQQPNGNQTKCVSSPNNGKCGGGYFMSGKCVCTPDKKLNAAGNACEPLSGSLPAQPPMLAPVADPLPADPRTVPDAPAEETDEFVKICSEFANKHYIKLSRCAKILAGK